MSNFKQQLEQRKVNRSSRTKPLSIDTCTAENLTFGATIKSKNIKLFINIIKTMCFSSDTEIQLSDAGFKYVVEDSKSFQVIAYIKKDFFSDYFIRIPKQLDLLAFGVNLTSFTNLLNAYLDDELSSMNISYYHSENSLLFIINQTDSGQPISDVTKQNLIENQNGEELAGEISTEYFLRTMHSVDPIDFNINSPQFLNSIIIDAVDLHENLEDFSLPIDELEIKITPQKMILRTVGVLQLKTMVKFECTNEAFSKFECFEPSKFRYKFDFFKTMMQGLVVSSKVSITTYVDGLLRLQLMVKVEENQESPAFLEYNMIPSLPDDDIDDADEV